MSGPSETQAVQPPAEGTKLESALDGWLAFMTISAVWAVLRYFRGVSVLGTDTDPGWDRWHWWLPEIMLGLGLIGVIVLAIQMEAGFRRIMSLANPTAFMQLSGKLLPKLAIVTAVLFAAGLLMSFRAPPDETQGHAARIMFIHVPAAWLSMACYTLIAISSAGYLIWRHPLADVSAKAAAPIGAAFTLLALFTGSLWGKPTWGAYWVWDARLTSVLVLFFLYLGLMALRQAVDDPGRAGRAAAILALIGAVNIPIIKFSVNWWNTLHQPASVIRAGGSTIHPSLLAPLFVMAIAFTLLFIALHLKAMRGEILRRRCEAMIAIHVRTGGAQPEPEGAATSHV
jgi:heme exporter protein C